VCVPDVLGALAVWHLQTKKTYVSVNPSDVGVLFASLFDPLFKRSRLHYFDICLTWYLWHIKIWWQHLVPTYRVCTAPRYAIIPKLTCWHVVSVLLNIWRSAPRYATIPILIWQYDVSVLFKIQINFHASTRSAIWFTINFHMCRSGPKSELIFMHSANLFWIDFQFTIN